MKKLIFLVYLLFITNCLLKKNHKGKMSKKDRKLSLIDVRGLVKQNENDNPLSELWDPNHIKVARQKVNMNLNMPINRLKLHMDDSYVVKVVVHNDQDFNNLYEYFYGKDKK